MALLTGCRDEERKDTGQSERSRGNARSNVTKVVCLSVPEMHSLEDAEHLTRILSEMDGVLAESIECDTDNGVLSLTVRGNSPSQKDIKRAIAKAGFAVGEE